MIDERKEFEAYTGKVRYEAKSKHDWAWRGRFVFDMLLDFTAFARILTILARGYLCDGGEPDIIVESQPDEETGSEEEVIYRESYTHSNTKGMDCWLLTDTDGNERYFFNTETSNYESVFGNGFTAALEFNEEAENGLVG